ncbi:MAG: DUF2062 domain-containing protein [Verrucomicrobia bacterium]|nr:DUF2062 domain-containing protein [Verrucomicrobiota bacterium]MDA1203943.1 DUF2062 domain-containing protein [Verrucomicrobiota bacterium]
MMRLRRSRMRPWLKKVPRQRHVRGTWLHRLLGDRLFTPELWRPTREGVARGAANGLFWAMMPIPFQMLPSGITAFFLRFNLPTAISVVWITNPVTWPFILYWQYRLGAWLLREDVPSGAAAYSLLDIAAGVPGPLLLGCAVTGLLAGALVYFSVNALWGAVAERWWRSHEHPRKPAGRER